MLATLSLSGGSGGGRGGGGGHAGSGASEASLETAAVDWGQGLLQLLEKAARQCGRNGGAGASPSGGLLESALKGLSAVAPGAIISRYHHIDP